MEFNFLFCFVQNLLDNYLRVSNVFTCSPWVTSWQCWQCTCYVKNMESFGYPKLSSHRVTRKLCQDPIQCTQSICNYQYLFCKPQQYNLHMFITERFSLILIRLVLSARGGTSWFMSEVDVLAVWACRNFKMMSGIFLSCFSKLSLWDRVSHCARILQF